MTRTKNESAKNKMSDKKRNEMMADVNSRYLKGDFKSAITLLIGAQLLYPSDYEVLYGLAVLYRKIGDFTKAEQTWRNYAQKFPNEYTDHHRIMHAETLIEVGLAEDARLVLKPISYWSKTMPEKEKLLQKLAMKGSAREDCFEIIDAKNMYASKLYQENIELRKKYLSKLKNREGTGKLKYSSVIIVTYGRTGSTLLQGLLNTIEGLTVLGENDNAFYHLYMYHKTIKEVSMRQNGEAPNGPFYGCSMPRLELTAEAIRNVINAYFYSAKIITGASCIGFKEVKYYQIGNDVIGYLDFIDRHFPEPLFIFLSRDHKDVVKSGWWKDMSVQEVLEQISMVESAGRDFAQGRKNTYFLDYDDVIGESRKLRKLFHKIGVRYSARRARVIFDTPHSYNPSRASVKNIFSGYGA